MNDIKKIYKSKLKNKEINFNIDNILLQYFYIIEQEHSYMLDALISEAEVQFRIRGKCSIIIESAINKISDMPIELLLER